MKAKSIGMIVLALVTACTVPWAPAVPTRTPTPMPRAIVSTPTLRLTSTPTPLPTATPSSAPPTATPRAPAIAQHFSLRELPGTGRRPSGVAVIGDKVYVLNVGTLNVAVIQNNRAVKFIPTGSEPSALAVDAAQKRLYVANGRDKTVSLITNDRTALTQDIGDEPGEMLFFENRLWVGLRWWRGILVLDPTTLQIEAHITAPETGWINGLAGDPIHHRIYATSMDKTAVIDSVQLRVLTTFDTGSSYGSVVVADPRNDSVLVDAYDRSSETTFLIAHDPLSGAERGRVKIGGYPSRAIRSADGTRVYLSDIDNNVSVIDLRDMTLIATASVGLSPKGLALDDAAHRLYVANAASDNLSVINTDTNQVVEIIPLAMSPTALVSNENTGRVFVTNASTDSVYVIEDARVTREIGVGHHPIDLARDERSNRLLVANAADRTFSIIAEADFSLRSTQPISQSFGNVAVDPVHSRAFAGGAILDLENLQPVGTLTTCAFGDEVGFPDTMRVNPNNERIYAIGGSCGSRHPSVSHERQTYVFDGATLQPRGPLGNSDYSRSIAIDPETNRLFVATDDYRTPPYHGLAVFDGNDNYVYTLPLRAGTTGMVFNPQTHHLILSGTDNTIQILDTDSFGEVARFNVDSPGEMARLGNTIYVVNVTDGSLTLIGDARTATPPSPTPTYTSTPSSAWTAIPATPTPRAAATPGATISGGGGSGLTNRVTDDYGTVSGGQNNRAGDNAGNTADRAHATVGGGYYNIASGQWAIVGGGYSNTASGGAATVGGGYSNIASGWYSFAAGYRANAAHDGSFVWADMVGSPSSFPFNLTLSNQFNVRATGGVRLVLAIDGSGNPTWTCSVSNGGAWSCSSDRNLKENLRAVDSREVLQRLSRVPIFTWNARGADPNVKHLGPTAQDLYAAFNLGEDDTHISTIDAEGVALAAIQGLNQVMQEKDAHIARLESRVSALERQNTDVQARLTALEQALQAGGGMARSDSSNVPALGLLFGGLALVGLVAAERQRTGGER